MTAELELLRRGLEQVTRERDAAVAAVAELEEELAHLRAVRESDARPTPAETPRALAVEAALRRLGPTTEGES